MGATALGSVSSCNLATATVRQLMAVDGKTDGCRGSLRCIMMTMMGVMMGRHDRCRDGGPGVPAPRSS